MFPARAVLSTLTLSIRTIYLLKLNSKCPYNLGQGDSWFGKYVILLIIITIHSLE